MRQRLPSLEPLGAVTFLILLAHAAMIAVLWWWLQNARPANLAADDIRSLRWFPPDDLATPKAQAVSPDVPAATDNSPASPAVPPVNPPADRPAPREPTRAADNSPAMRPYEPPGRHPRIEIVLSRPRSSGAGVGQQGGGPAGLQAVALSGTEAADLDAVDQAIMDAFRQNWTVASDIKLTGDQSTVHMDVSIARDGRIIDYRLVKPSRNTKLDMSALQAASLIKKIPISLPPEFSGDTYQVQMHFHAE